MTRRMKPPISYKKGIPESSLIYVDKGVSFNFISEVVDLQLEFMFNMFHIRHPTGF